MSDYLWDKSGEPDAEVERLEELLGELRYQPGRKLELPPETNALARSRARRYPAFAVAAALALMVIAGLWLAVVRRHGGAPPDARVAENPTGAATPAPTASAPAAPHGTNAIAATGENELKNSSGDGDRRAAPRRPERFTPASARRPSARRSYQDDSMRRAQIASNARRRRKADSPEMVEAERAKEQLMLALHVASAKLNLAQRKAPGITDVTY